MEKKRKERKKEREREKKTFITQESEGGAVTHQGTTTALVREWEESKKGNATSVFLWLLPIARIYRIHIDKDHRFKGKGHT